MTGRGRATSLPKRSEGTLKEQDLEIQDCQSQLELTSLQWSVCSDSVSPGWRLGNVRDHCETVTVLMFCGRQKGTQTIDGMPRQTGLPHFAQEAHGWRVTLLIF